MRPGDLKPGDRVLWNGHPATVTMVTGTPGQRHPWSVELVFDEAPDAAPLTLAIPADTELERP